MTCDSSITRNIPTPAGIFLLWADNEKQKRLITGVAVSEEL